MKYVTTIGDKEYSVEIIDKGHISINGKIMEVDFRVHQRTAGLLAADRREIVRSVH